MLYTVSTFLVASTFKKSFEDKQFYPYIYMCFLYPHFLILSKKTLPQLVDSPPLIFVIVEVCIIYINMFNYKSCVW